MFCVRARMALCATMPFKIAVMDTVFFAAFTPTQPQSFTACGLRMKTKNSPFSELLSGQVFKEMVMPDRIACIHDSTSDTGLVRTAMQLQLRGCSHFNTSAIGGLPCGT
jgi:hypothetical protein